MTHSRSITAKSFFVSGHREKHITEVIRRRLGKKKRHGNKFDQFVEKFGLDEFRPRVRSDGAGKSSRSEL